MNKLYVIVDEKAAVPIGIVNNKEDIEFFIRSYNKDTGSLKKFFYQVYTKNKIFMNSWIPEEISPISMYEDTFYYKDEIMPNGEKVQ